MDTWRDTPLSPVVSRHSILRWTSTRPAKRPNPHALLERQLRQGVTLPILQPDELMKSCRFSKPQSKSDDWKKEDANRLHRKFITLEAKRKTGKSVNELLTWFSWFWKGKAYRSATNIRVRYSIPTLRRRYYIWRNNGRTPQALALKYCPGNRRVVKQSEIARFVRQAATPGTFTFAAAFAATQRTRPVSCSATHFFRSLPIGLSKQLRDLFYSRRQQRAIESRFARKAGLA